MSSEKKTTAILVIEAMGRPKEHLVQTLEELTENMKKEKGVKIVENKIHEPTEVKDKKDLFTTFTEIEVEVEKPIILALLMFKYMPAHVEVIEPETFTIENHEFTEILSELTRRLHKYDELLRVMQMEHKIATNQLKKFQDEKK